MVKYKKIQKKEGTSLMDKEVLNYVIEKTHALKNAPT